METECKHCGKQILNKGSLTVHEIYYCKSNPEKKEKASNFIEYNRKLKAGEVKKEFGNQFIKAKLIGTQVFVSDETKKKISDKAKHQVWTDERRNAHSESMRKAVEQNPLSYSVENVCCRVKKTQYNGTWLTGMWEVEVAKFLDQKGIKWTNKIDPIRYVWEERDRNYFPDFYLPDFDLYIEVKGIQVDRDDAKWSVVENLMIVKEDGIKAIRSGEDLEIKANNPYFKK